MDLKLSRYHVVTPPFVDAITNRTKRIIFATRTAAMRAISETGWQNLRAERFDLLPKEVLLDFVDIELIVSTDEDELATILNRNNAAAIDDDVLYLVIQPTAYCQLGCNYCGQKHSHRWLSPEDQIRFVERAQTKLEAKRFQKVLICWFGAEPLAGLPVIRSLTPQLKTLSEKFNCGYEAKIVTNGLALTDSVATEIVEEHAVRFIEITLDGVAEFHDARRHRKNGSATFEQIFENTIALARREDLDVQMRIRCNVDQRNYEGVLPLLQMLTEAGVQRRIGFYVAPVHSWGNNAHALSLAQEEFASREIEWMAQMIQLGFKPILIPERKSIVCMAVKPHAELVDAGGTLFNCTEVSYVPTYGTPNKYAIGHVSHGEFLGQRHQLGDFNDRVGRGDYPCSTCRMLPVCGGSCPKQWQEGLLPCPSTKYNIEERLLLNYAASRIDQASTAAK